MYTHLRFDTGCPRQDCNLVCQSRLTILRIDRNKKSHFAHFCALFKVFCTICVFLHSFTLRILKHLSLWLILRIYANFAHLFDGGCYTYCAYLSIFAHFCTMLRTSAQCCALLRSFVLCARIKFLTFALILRIFAHFRV